MIIPNKVNPNGSGKPDKFTLPDISSTAYQSSFPSPAH